jgi:hypothetical protein
VGQTPETIAKTGQVRFYTETLPFAAATRLALRLEQPRRWR